MLGQSSSESSGLLVSEIVGGSALNFSASLVNSLLVDHSKNLSDGLSHKLKRSSSATVLSYSYAGKLDLGSSGNLADSELSELLLHANAQNLDVGKLTLNLPSSSIRAFSSFCLSSWALTLCIFVNLIYN